MRLGLVLLLATVWLSSIAQVRETGTGLKHEFLVDQSGATAKIGDLVTLHMLIKSANGEEVRDSRKQGKPILFPSRVSSFGADIYEAVRLMSEGDSARFWINADSMYLRVFKQDMPDAVKTGSELEVIIKTYKIRSQKAYQEEQKSFYDKNLKEEEAVIAQRKKDEEQKIQAFIQASGFDYKKTSSGAYYAVTDEGNDEKIFPKDGNAVVFSYVGMLIDGTEFETTEKDVGHAVTFTLGKNMVIKGWEEVFPNIPRGAKAQMVIPSHLGYGNIAKGEKLPANSILIFDVHVTAVY